MNCEQKGQKGKSRLENQAAEGMAKASILVCRYQPAPERMCGDRRGPTPNRTVTGPFKDRRLSREVESGESGSGGVSLSCGEVQPMCGSARMAALRRGSSGPRYVLWMGVAAGPT